MSGRLLSHVTVQPLAGQYTRPDDQVFAPSPPAQYGHAQATPSNTQGNTQLGAFFKVNRVLAPGPIAKIIIKTQQARL